MEQIAAALEAAGWQREPFRSPGSPIFTSPGKPPAGIVGFVGLSIYVDAKLKELMPAVAALRDALRLAKLNPDARMIVDNTEDEKAAIHIYIGEKPRDVAVR